MLRILRNFVLIETILNIYLFTNTILTQYYYDCEAQELINDDF
jgi:hypothetical protein